MIYLGLFLQCINQKGSVKFLFHGSPIIVEYTQLEIHNEIRKGNKKCNIISNKLEIKKKVNGEMIKILNRGFLIINFLIKFIFYSFFEQDVQYLC